MHLVHLSKSRASVDLQKRQMERERESEWRRKQRQTAGNRKETGETRRGEGRTDEDGQIRGRKKRREAIRQWEGKLQRRSNTNYKMFISRSLLKHFGTDEFVAKDLKNKREIQWQTGGRRNAAGSFRRARKMFTFDEFDIFFLNRAPQSRFNGRFVSMRRWVAPKQINKIAWGRNNTRGKTHLFILTWLKASATSHLVTNREHEARYLYESN